MNMQAAVSEALEICKEELDAGSNASKAVSYACSETGCKENVLIIRFEKAYGVTPENYNPPKSVSVDLKARAKELADKEMANWRNGSTRYTGVRFFHNGEWWVGVVSDSVKLIAIREIDGRRWTLRQKAMKQAEATLKLKGDA